MGEHLTDCGWSLLMGVRHIVLCWEEHFWIPQLNMGHLGDDPQVAKGRDKGSWERNQHGQTGKVECFTYNRVGQCMYVAIHCAYECSLSSH